MNRKTWNIILIIAAVAGCAFRLLDFAERSLEYDEIWMLAHYFKCSFTEIFTALETPNNHPLYTLCAKWVYNAFGETAGALRLPALISGFALSALAVWAALKYLRSKYARIAFVVMVAFSPYLIHYSNTARGYSMQAFFVFALMLLLFSYAKKPSIWKASGVFFTAAAALFTVYSGLIFVCAAGGAYMLSFFKWKDWKKELKKHLFFFAAGADFIIIAALWLGLNWEKITKAQHFGTQITSVMQFFRSVGHLICDLQLILPLIIILLAFILRPKDRVLRFGLSFSLLTFISMLATKCGPERVYVPMITVALFAAARGIGIIGVRFRKIRFIEIILLLAVCFPVFFISSQIERISSPDWRYFVMQIEKNIPDDCFVFYSAGDTYPIFFNYNESALNLAKKSAGELTMAAFITLHREKISCFTEDVSEKTLPLDKPFEVYPLTNNYNMSVYKLEPFTVENFKKNRTIIVFFTFIPKAQYLNIRNQLYLKDDCYLMNAFFNRDYTVGDGGQPLKAVQLFIPEAAQEFEYYSKFTRPGLKIYILNSQNR